MSDSVNYDVSATLKVAGASQFANDMNRGASAATGLGASLKTVKEGAMQLGGGLLGLAEKAAAVAVRVGAVGASVAVAATAAGAMAIGKNLSMLEDKSIQLTAVVAAATERTFGAVRAETTELFNNFKKDAVTSAGETKDFIDTASKLAGPLLGAGKSMADLRTITQGVIATAPALGVKFEQAGSDVMRMLQGGAGADLPFFKALQSIPSLGVASAEAFNKLQVDKRIEIVRKALTNPAFLAAAAEAGNTFTGLTSTLSDQAKTLGGIAAGPVFEMLKRKMQDLTRGMLAGIGENGDGQLARSFMNLGNRVASRFGELERSMGRIFPDLANSADGFLGTLTNLADAGLGRVVQATDWIGSHWEGITAGAKAFAGWISAAADRAGDLLRSLGGGDLVKGVERAALLYGGVKAGSALAPMAGGAMQLGNGLLGAGSAASKAIGKEASGFMGGLGASLSAQAASAKAFFASDTMSLFPAATAATSAAGAGASGAGGTAATAAAAGGVGAAASALAVLAAAAVVASGAIMNVKDNFLGVGTFIDAQMQRAEAAMGPLKTSLSGLWDALGRLWVSAEPLLKTLLATHPAVLLVTGAIAALVAAAEPLINALTWLSGVLTQGATTATNALTQLDTFFDGIAKKLGISHQKAVLEDVAQPEVRGYDLGTFNAGPLMGAATSAFQPSSPGKSASPKSGGGGKVEVVIKWDLGEGNEEAIFVKTRQNLIKSLNGAKGFVRSGPMPGVF